MMYNVKDQRLIYMVARRVVYVAACNIILCKHLMMLSNDIEQFLIFYFQTFK